MKKTLYLLVAIVLLFSSITAPDAIAQKQTKARRQGSSLYDAEQILYLPAGYGGDYSVGYLEDEPFNVGPQSFVVENGKIYVLDTVNARIIIEESGRFSTVDIPEVKYPKHMCVLDGSIYIISDMNNCMYEIKPDRSINTFNLPESIEAEDISRLYAYDHDEIRLMDHNLETYSLDRGTHEWNQSYKVLCNALDKGRYSVSDNMGGEAIIYTGLNTIVQYINSLSDRVLVGVYELVPNIPVIMFEKTIRIFDRNGGLLGCTVIEDSEAFSFPEDGVYEASDGTIYVMHCLKDGVYITRPNFRLEYDSNMEQITEEAHEIFEHYNKKSSTRGPAITTLTRATVRTRAMSCVNYKWTFNPTKNATLREYNGVTIELPCEEAAAIANNPTQSVELKGIPYCRGMHDGPDDFQTKLNSKYPDSTSPYYTAGNVAAHHVLGSTGLDCSGLVCYAYDAPSCYWTTASFANSNNGYYISSIVASGPETEGHINMMKKMDYIVKSDDHIVLFDKWNTNASVKIIHASRSLGKVVRVNYSFNNLRGFLMKSPYSCTETGCQYTFTDLGITHKCTCSICGYSYEEGHVWTNYAHDARYHWSSCAKCGAPSGNLEHNWVQTIGGYRCTTCGRFSTAIPVPGRVSGIFEEK